MDSNLKQRKYNFFKVLASGAMDNTSAYRSKDSRKYNLKKWYNKVLLIGKNMFFIKKCPINSDLIGITMLRK